LLPKSSAIFRKSLRPAIVHFLWLRNTLATALAFVRFPAYTVFSLNDELSNDVSPDLRAAKAGRMTDSAIELDAHRGMMAQKATELRRLLAEVEADERALRLRQEELEAHLLAAPAADWSDAAEKVRYLLKLFAATSAGQDPRRQTLIANVLDDFARLSAEALEETSPT
jgi:hypothetical protein